MTDKELADASVAILPNYEGPNNYGGYAYPYQSGVLEWMHPHDFVRDWRVVGAVMEKCLRIVIHKLSDGWTVTAINDRDEGITIFNESLPRAIIEACVKAKASS